MNGYNFLLWNVCEWICFITSPCIWMGWGPGTPAAHPFPKPYQVTPPPPAPVRNRGTQFSFYLPCLRDWYYNIWTLYRLARNSHISIYREAKLQYRNREQQEKRYVTEFLKAKSTSYISLGIIFLRCFSFSCNFCFFFLINTFLLFCQ